MRQHRHVEQRLEMNKYKYPELTSLVKAFCAGVVKHRENMFTDHVVANRYFESYSEALKKLYSLGEPGISALEDLLQNPRPSVRVMVAIYLISMYPNRCISVLQSEVNERSPLSAEALVTLERWKRGRYLDPLTGKEKAK
jgi:hypothetical protein